MMFVKMENIRVLILTLCFHLFITDVEAAINIALNKPASQSSIFPLFNWTADLAVDGNVDPNVINNECSVTNDREPPPEVAWWNVDLEQESRIKRIQIIVRTDIPNAESRLAGYDVFVSSSSAVTDPTTQSGSVCFNHTGPLLPTGNQNLECSLLGRFVSIYNERLENVTYPNLYSPFAILELCEVIVTGCPHGRYGMDGSCNDTCSVGCYNMDCDPENGTCLFGCKTGWENDTCSVCQDGYYGMNCSQMCSPGCNMTICDKDNGDCQSQCLHGYNGTRCDICSDRYYGWYCNMTCPSNCNATTCDKEDGSCSGSCNEGWTGSLCDQVVQEPVVSDGTLDEQTTMYIVLGSIGGVILIAIVIVIIYTTSKRKRKKQEREFHEGPYQNEFMEPYKPSSRSSQSKPQQADISGVRL